MATINPSQDYDVIHTLTFEKASGTCKIRLYRGSTSAYTGTVYYRAGTSGAWTQLDVSGTTTTFPVSSTTMQIGHDNNKSVNDYMTVSFYAQITNLTGIAISQKAVFSGTMGNYFMFYYATGCIAITSLAVPDTSGLTSVGEGFMYAYAYGCTHLTSLAVPDTSGLAGVDEWFMGSYALNCTALVRLELPAAGWFVGHDIDWGMPQERLNYLKGYVSNATDQTAWQALTASGKTLYLNYVRSEDDVILEGGVSDLSVSVYDSVTVSENVSILIPALAPLVSVYDSVTVSENVSILLPALNPSVYDSVTVSENISILLPALVPSVYDSVAVSEDISILLPALVPLVAEINPSQDYDVIHTLTFAAGSGTCKIRLYRGSSSAYTGTVYYRAGTSGEWTELSVSGTTTTFPVSSTTMQIGHDNNKSGDDYMTVSFYEQSTNLIGIAISQKAVFSGTMGNYFMYNYAYNCSSLASLAVPDTSGLTSVGNNFMYYYASNCTALTSLAVPDTSGLNSVGTAFMYNYAGGCTALASLAVPDTSGLTSVGNAFMYSYAGGCTALASLAVPDTSGLNSVGSAFMAYYANGCTALTSLAVPDTSVLTSVRVAFMDYYAGGCTALLRLELPAAGWFVGNNIDWKVPSGRLNHLKGYVTNSTDQTAWQALTASGKTLYLNYVRSEDDVILEAGVSDLSVSVYDSVTVSEANFVIVGRTYTKGDYSTLPSNSTALESAFSGQEYSDVGSKNDVRVAQTAIGQYAIFEFKDYVGAETSISLEWEGQTDKAPSAATVYLQIYNVSTTAWDEVDTDNTSSVNTDFTLSGTIADLTNYKDGDSAISCRVYQQS